MKRSLWLVCDASGSMQESAKRLIVRGLVKQVEQLLRYGYCEDRDLELVAWRDGVVRVSWGSGEEVPDAILDCSGSADMSALLEFLRRVDGDVLILTDGFWDASASESFESWRADRNVRVVGVGPDAGGKASDFGAEDFVAQTADWLS